MISDWRAQVYKLYSIIITVWRAQVYKMYSVIICDCRADVYILYTIIITDWLAQVYKMYTIIITDYRDPVYKLGYSFISYTIYGCPFHLSSRWGRWKFHISGLIGIYHQAHSACFST